MEKIKLSIIVPCYKVEKYLPRCLDSLMNQALDGVETICINDGSPDRCIEILRNYQKKYADKLVIIDKENEGVWKGRRDGIKAAKGEYIGFVDSDDYVALDYAEKLYNKAKEEGADISVCGFDRVELTTGKLYSREMCKSSDKIIEVEKDQGGLLEMNGAPWNKIYRADLLKKMPDLQNPPPILDDMMFLLLIFLNSKKIVFVNESLVYYQVRRDSIINTIKENQLKETYDAMLEVKKIYMESETGRKMLEMLDAMAFLHFGVSLMFRLSYDKSCNLKRAIEHNNMWLDKNFPTWRNNEYISIQYVISNQFVNFKLWIVKSFYKVHLFRLFLGMYRFMIDKIGLDIKW